MLFRSPRTEFEIGGRYVYGWGRFQKDLGIQTLGIDSLASRLTYDGMNTNGGEVFARLDTHNNIMVKGLIGAGSGGGTLAAFASSDGLREKTLRFQPVVGAL